MNNDPNDVIDVNDMKDLSPNTRSGGPRVRRRPTGATRANFAALLTGPALGDGGIHLVTGARAVPVRAADAYARKLS